MFRCQNCDKVVPTSTRSAKIVVQVREKEYRSRGSDPSERRRYPRGRGPKKKTKFDRGGSGHEIVREVMVCPECAATMTPATPPPRKIEAVRIDDDDDFDS